MLVGGQHDMELVTIDLRSKSRGACNGNEDHQEVCNYITQGMQQNNNPTIAAIRC